MAHLGPQPYHEHRILFLQGPTPDSSLVYSLPPGIYTFIWNYLSPYQISPPITLDEPHRDNVGNGPLRRDHLIGQGSQEMLSSPATGHFVVATQSVPIHTSPSYPETELSSGPNGLWTEAESSGSQPSCHAPNSTDGDTYASTDQSQSQDIVVDSVGLSKAISKALPSPLNSVLRSWAGTEREAVLAKVLEEVDTDLHSMSRINPTRWRGILSPLCGMDGPLCSARQDGPRKRLISITCHKCPKVFDRRNPIEKYAHHLITDHYEITPFKCQHANCGAAFSWSQDCRRHEKTIHGGVVMEPSSS